MRSGEIARLAGVTVRTLRHYRSIGLLPEPNRSDNGYCEYTLDDLLRLLRIKHHLIQATLEISKMAVSGESPRNICSVQAVNLNAGINEQKLA